MWIGIDVGTTNSCVSYWDGRGARMVEIGEGMTTIMPSVITIVGDQVLVGQDAIEAGRKHPDFCYRHFKRKLAERWLEDEDQGYQTCAGPDGTVHFRGPDGSTYSPTELTAFLINALVQAANLRLPDGELVTGAVICVPADFTQPQRACVEEAARMAGLSQVELMHEPTAAALAYGFDAKRARRIAVFDLGGGTFDVSIVQTGGGLVDVLTTNGIRDLGGSDYDRRIADYIVNLWRTEHGVDLAVRDAAMQRVLITAEAVKKRLSEKPDTRFKVDDIGRTKDGVSLHMDYPISQAVLEELTADLRERMLNACKSAIQDVRRSDPNFTVTDLHDVLLVGGMTRVPSVREAAQVFFGKKPKRDESPEMVVAMGAAIKAAIVEGRRADITIADITSHALCVESLNGVATVLVPKGVSYPFEETFTLTNAAPGQLELSIRLVQGEAHKAALCEPLWAVDVPIEPSEPQSARIPLTIRIDASGRPTAEVEDYRYEGVAA
jgi:molecular chaperone DnaK